MDWNNLLSLKRSGDKSKRIRIEQDETSGLIFVQRVTEKRNWKFGWNEIHHLFMISEEEVKENDD